MRLLSTFLSTVISTGLCSPSMDATELPDSMNIFFENHCMDCHDDEITEGGLDFLSLTWQPEDSHNESIWVKIHDRIKSKEMPPPKKSKVQDAEREELTQALGKMILEARESAYAQNGRSVSRRINRFEYENVLRDLLHDPYLKIAGQLPLDGEVHGFAKVGTALDVSHVQVDAYLDVAEFALRRVLDFPEKKPEPTIRRKYAREENQMWLGRGNPGWARFSLALDGLQINDYHSFVKAGLDPVIKRYQNGIIVDDDHAEFIGPWRKSNVRSNHVGAHYLATNKDRGPYEVKWKAVLPKPGTYEVRVSFGGGEGLSTAAPYIIHHAKGETRLLIDQSTKPTIDNLWFPLGRFTFGEKDSASVSAEISLSDKGTEGYLIADAIQFLYMDDLKNTEDRSTYLEDSSTAIFRGAYTPFYYGFNGLKAPARGNYRIRLKAKSVLRETDYVEWEGEKEPRFYPGLVLDATRRFPTPVNDRILPAKRSEPVKVYSSTLHEPNLESILPIGVFEAPPNVPEIFELEAYIEKGGMVKLDCMRLPSPMVPALPHVIQKIDPDGYPGVAFHWMELEGPIIKKWPPAAYQALFGDLPFKKEEGKIHAISEDPSKDARELLADFMNRAYRRPVTDTEFERFYNFTKAQLEENSLTDSLLATYAAILSSPEFLFHRGQPGGLDDFSLAERLSFFLGESMPDQRLRKLAKNGKLSNPTILRSEVDRLLSQPKSERFVQKFLDSWLKLDEINDTDPDRDLYPEYAGDWWLVNSIIKESRLFFTDLFTNNRPARNVIDANYTFLDERIAKHYGVDGIKGTEFRRYELPEDSPYGGILTQASVLKVTANGTTTSPVLRGVYVLEHLLGKAPSPPPPSVPAVEPDIRGAKTIRELLAKHREDPSCASCHKSIDPPGFALENFDIMGGWRDHYRSLELGSKKVAGIGRSGNEFVHYVSKKVDASGKTSGGTAFTDIIEYKKHLLQDERAIARNLAEQFIVYATGAPVGFADRDVVSDILDKCKPSEYGVRTLIHEIIQSPLFLRK